MQRLEGLGAIPLVKTHAPAVNTIALVTLDAPTDGSRHAVDWISWSYDKDNVAVETLQLVIAGKTIIWYIPIGAATAITVMAARHMPFPVPIVGAIDGEVTVALSAAGAAVKGSVTVGYR